MDNAAIIWTEGKTDWQHLKRAFQVLDIGHNLAFEESYEDWGEDRLLKQCKALSRVKQAVPTIFIFDRDNDAIIQNIEDSKLGYKHWGNNVYSFAIPIPSHRNDNMAICIESYYTDGELQTKDEEGRRLFLSTEFNPKSGRHLKESNLSIGNKGKLGSLGKGARAKIIDSEIYDELSRNVALSKAEFAQNVVSGKGSFGKFRFESFLAIFNIINSIIELVSEKIDLAFYDPKAFFDSLDNLKPAQQFMEIVRAAIRACKLTTMIFIAAILRHYEQKIIDESSTDLKKVRPIKQILAQSFGHPSLTTLQNLARYCYHLVDDSAPSVVYTLRGIMGATPTLGAIGNLIDELEHIFPPPREQVRIVNKSQLNKPILEYLIKEFSKYEGRMAELLEIDSPNVPRSVNLAEWKEALLMLLDCFSPLKSLSFRVRRIERIRNDSDEFDILITTYQNDRVSVEEETRTYEDIDDNQMETYELLVSPEEGKTALDLFPFIIIRNNKLHYYNRTKARGYEYNAVFTSKGYLEPIKRKFSQVALRTNIAADLQALFWTQVTPTVSELGIRANIPAHGPVIGRKQQLADIMTEIIEIPNQNGIIYGPGGVGKTALLIELSRNLFEEPCSDPILFKNIVWVSAKPNYYDPTLDRVEVQQPQFQSLDNILTAILEFHEIEDAITYKTDEKKFLVLELLRDEKTLLILDNFESVAKAGQEEILKFFGVTAKQTLKDKPNYFKVLVTSRKLIPSGFHQYRLKGLDKGESKKLMAQLFVSYARSGRQQLTEEQQNKLYEATDGIPLIIKHCYGQIYEYNRKLDEVIKGLSKAGSKIVDFSFAEVFDLIKQDELQLQLILLLELCGRRLLSRQIADILTVDEAEITDRIAQLVNYQCVNIISIGTEEKYGINDEVKFLTRRLAIENASLATKIKQKIANLSIDKRMDYTQQELDAVLFFEDYISQGHYLLGENFIKEQLKNRPLSLLLNLHYAKYLKEIKRRTHEAIEILEKILKASGSDQQVLRLLMAYYIALEIPNYEQAHSYARELEYVSEQNNEIKTEIAQFYLAWSTALKNRKIEIDPIKEMMRQQKYKDLASKAIAHLKAINSDTHEWHHLLAQSYYNVWDYDLAMAHVDKAIALLPKGSHLYFPYQRLQGEILKKQDKYSHIRRA